MILNKIPIHEWNTVLGLKEQEYRFQQLGHDEIKLLYSPVISDVPVDVPDSEKVLTLYETPTSRYREAYDYINVDFIDMGEFTYELYLAMPYFVEIYQMWKQKQDFQWQVLFLFLIGNCLSTDFPRNHFNRRLNETFPKEIIETYSYSIEIIREEAREFVAAHLERLKQLSIKDAEQFCQGLLAILGDREAAYVLFMGQFNICTVACPHCFDPNDEVEYNFDWYVRKHPDYPLGKELIPAPSVIGQWDRKSFDNDYLWMSNLLYLLGCQDGAKKMSFYYGTLICPNCGKEAGIVMDLAKKHMIWDGESSQQG